VVVFGSVEVSISLSHQCFLVSFLWHFFLTSIGRDRGSMVRCRGIRVDSSSIIGHISNIASIAISLVSNMLGTAIRKSNRVRSLSIASTITCLSSLEVGVGVVISYSIGVGVGGGHIRVGRGFISRGSMNNWGMVSRGSVDNRGMVSRGSVDNRSSVDNRGMVSRGSMDYRSSMDNRGMVSWGSMVDWSSMVSRSMSKNSLCSMKTVRRVSNSSNSCSKSLGLSGAPVFSLVWPGY